MEFIKDSHVMGDPIGFFNQTCESIANATNLKRGGDFWLSLDDQEEVAGYALANVVKDIDNRLCYWVTQGWTQKKYRNGTGIRDAWKTLENQAKTYFCSHIVNVTNRNPDAYIRLLGNGWNNYATILIKELGG